MGLALADAFNLRRMQGINFTSLSVFVLPLPLVHHAGGEAQRVFEYLLQLGLICNVADGAAQIGLEFSQLLPCPLELLGMT